MFLFPMEDKVYDLLNPDWAKLEASEFSYEFDGKEKKVPILFCNGNCDRYQRPLACRIFPLTPYLDSGGKLEIIVDPRAKSICPLSRRLDIENYNYKYVKNIKKAFSLLMKNSEFKEYMKTYSEYLDEYRKFF